MQSEENQNLENGSVGGDEAKLREELAAMTKKATELEVRVRGLEGVGEETTNRNQALERERGETTRLLRDSEKQLDSARIEKEDLSRDLCDAQEKLKLQSKELKDALQQRKLAMSEYTEATDKLSELRQQKQKLSRQVRDKEEELENSLTKIDNLRQDIRKAEKLRRELEVRAEEAFTETTKERKAREKAEAELDRLRAGSTGEMERQQNSEEGAEVARLVSELDKAEVEHSEAMLLASARHQQEISAMTLQLEAAEAERARVEAELEQRTEKVERSRNQELQESEDVVVEIRNLHEREKALLMEENQKLSAELERSLEISTRLQSDRRHLEEEYADLEGKKETVAQWENQIGEIIQWVSDEKDARGYLQALAGKLTEEMEILKVPDTSQPEKNWKN